MDPKNQAPPPYPTQPGGFVPPPADPYAQAYPPQQPVRIDQTFHL